MFFANVSIQISAISSTFSATDFNLVFLICFDIFSSMFLILTIFESIKWSLKAWVSQNMHQESP